MSDETSDFKDCDILNITQINHNTKIFRIKVDEKAFGKTHFLFSTSDFLFKDFTVSCYIKVQIKGFFRSDGKAGRFKLIKAQFLLYK